MGKKQSNCSRNSNKKDIDDDHCDFDNINLTREIMIRLPAKSQSRIKCAPRPRRMLDTDNVSEREIHANSSGLFYRVSETKYTYTNKTKTVAMVHEVLRQPSYTFMASGMLPAAWTPQLSLSFLPCYPNFSILDSCNGLLLCNSFQNRFSEQFICNPLMKTWITLPPKKPGNRGSYGQLLAYDPKKFSPHFKVLGQAYDPKKFSPHFKVLGQPILPRSPTGAMELEEFSSETGKWNKLELPMSGSEPPPGWNCKHGARLKCFLNGIVYAFVHPQYLIAISLKEETRYYYHCIKLPEPCYDIYRLSHLTGVSNGHLYHIMNDKSVIRVWIMQDGGKWVLKRTVLMTDLAEMVSLPDCFRHWGDGLCDFLPVALHPVMSVVFLRTHCMVFKYDFLSGKVEEVSQLSRRNHQQTDSQVASCCFSLHSFSPCSNPLELKNNWRQGVL